MPIRRSGKSSSRWSRRLSRRCSRRQSPRCQEEQSRLNFSAIEGSDPNSCRFQVYQVRVDREDEVQEKKKRKLSETLEEPIEVKTGGRCSKANVNFWLIFFMKKVFQMQIEADTEPNFLIIMLNRLIRKPRGRQTPWWGTAISTTEAGRWTSGCRWCPSTRTQSAGCAGRASTSLPATKTSSSTAKRSSSKEQSPAQELNEDLGDKP